MTSLGFVVLARRPGSIEPVSAVFPTLEQAQNALESRKRPRPIVNTTANRMSLDPADPVEYVIGEIGEWSGR